MVAPHVSAGLGGFSGAGMTFFTREAMPVGRSFLPAPMPADTGSRPYPCPPDQELADTRIFSARCHLYFVP